MDKTPKTAFTLAGKIGTVALGSALLLCLVSPTAAAIVLAGFLLLCLVAPFFPAWGFFLPVISRGEGQGKAVALTFDDGPSPASTPIILELLARYHLSATFFVVGEKAARYPELLAKIVAAGHTIGNHSWNHDYFLMLRGTKTLRQNIRATQEILLRSGIEPLVFRPPVGITGPRLGAVLAEEGLVTVNYSRRAFDLGNRNIGNLAGKIVKRLRPGDIIMLHDLPVGQKNRDHDWVRELERLFAVLAKEYHTLPLDQLIRRPVMRLRP